MRRVIEDCQRISGVREAPDAQDARYAPGGLTNKSPNPLLVILVPDQVIGANGATSSSLNPPRLIAIAPGEYFVLPVDTAPGGQFFALRRAIPSGIA